MKNTVSEESEPNVKVIRDYAVSDGILKHEDTIRLRPSSLLEHPTILQDRYKDQGYLYIKGLVSRDGMSEALKSDVAFAAMASTQHGRTRFEDNTATTMPPCKCSTCPIRKEIGLDCTSNGLARLKDFPELKGLVLSITTSDPHAQRVSSGSSDQPRAWIALTNFHPQGGGPIFLQRSPNYLMSNNPIQLADNDKCAPSRPLELAKQSGRRWMVTAYSVGDVVVYDSDVVSNVKVEASKDETNESARLWRGPRIATLEGAKVSAWTWSSADSIAHARSLTSACSSACHE